MSKEQTPEEWATTLSDEDLLGRAKAYANQGILVVSVFNELERRFKERSVACPRCAQTKGKKDAKANVK
jgi:hypothetical protein